MKATDFLHKRILVSVIERGSFSNRNSTVEELKILEVSPSENWVKIQDKDGRKYWKLWADLVIAEVLINLPKPPAE